MSLDAIANGFSELRNNANPDLTLGELGDAERGQIAEQVVAALDTGSNEISTDDINLLLGNADNLTIDQAIAYMYQMLSLVDTDASTEDIELGGETFEAALATALGIEDEGEVTTELGDLATVFSQADVTLVGLDGDDLNASSVDNDRIELNFSANDDIPSVFDDLEDTTITALGLTDLDSGTDEDGIISWGYIPSDVEAPETSTGEIGVIDDATGLDAGQTIIAGSNAGTATDENEVEDGEDAEVVEEEDDAEAA